MMKDNSSKIGLKIRLISILSIFCLLALAINQGIAQQYTKEEDYCYGFIVSAVKCENITIQDQINCKIRHLINDLLREDIPVYWASSEITTFVKEIDQDL